MIVDLVSPWLAALEATDPVHARTLFRTRHRLVLERLRRARAPLQDVVPLAADIGLLRIIAHRAADPAQQQQIRDALAHAAELGADWCRGVVLVAGDGTGDPAEPIPWPDAEVALFLDRIDDEAGMVTAIAMAVAAVTRWGAGDSRASVRQEMREHWNRWDAARQLPLREWIYTEGVGLHLAHALQPALEPHQLCGVSPAAFHRLRERERALRAVLESDLDQTGIGLLLRWLTPNAATGPRSIGDLVVPPMAGRYLGWRMLSDRVARVGLRETMRMESSVALHD